MNITNVQTLCLMIIAFLFLYMIILVRDYRLKLNIQNARLIQLYLDKKFISKLLNALVEVNNTKTDILSDILSDIKEYFHLDDIVIYNQAKMATEPAPGFYLRHIIATYIKNNTVAIFNKLKDNNVIIEKINNDRMRCSLYMLGLPVGGRQHVVAFVHNLDTQLERHDIDTLAKPIRGILATVLNFR